MRNKKAVLPVVPYIFWMTIFIVVPLILVVCYAFSTAEGGFSLENFRELGGYSSIFVRSMGMAAVATAVSLLIGYPVAFAIARESARTQKILMMLVMLPMWINFLLRTYAWMSILENTGLLNRLLMALGLPTLRIINTPAAVVLGMVYNYLPFMIMPIHSVISKIPRAQIEAAQDLGANSFKVFTKVILPLSIPGVLSGVTMVFVPAVSTFTLSVLLGGGKELMLGDLIEMQFLGTAYDPHLGSAIALVMMVIVLVCMGIMNRFGEGEETAVML